VQGRGCQRTLSCQCELRSQLATCSTRCCPVHAMETWLSATEGKDPDELLLSDDGVTPWTHQKTVENWVARLQYRKQCLGLEQPIEEFQGHSLRRTGAKRLVRLGLTKAQIAWLGRWRSIGSVDTYVEECRDEVAHLWPQQAR